MDELSRRSALRTAGALVAGGLVTGSLAGWTRMGDDDVAPGTSPERWAYGDDPSQWCDLYRPAGATRGTVVVIHGGFWRAAYGADLGAPLAADLAARGWTAWNVEYRRVGNGGGWPTTFTDVAAAIDLLSAVGDRLGADVIDLDRVVTLGHSAGGHLAVWAAGRPHLDADVPGAEPVVTVTGAISQAGVLDLVDGAHLGAGAVVELLGGTPDEVPERYAAADPIGRLPLGVAVRCVHGRADTIVPLRQSVRYVEAARVAGDDATLVEVDGDHMAMIDVGSQAWPAIVAAVDDQTS